MNYKRIIVWLDSGGIVIFFFLIDMILGIRILIILSMYGK